MNWKECGSDATDCTFVSSLDIIQVRDFVSDFISTIWSIWYGPRFKEAQYVLNIIKDGFSKSQSTCPTCVSDQQKIDGQWKAIYRWLHMNFYHIGSVLENKTFLVSRKMDSAKITTMVWSQAVNVEDKQKLFAKWKKSLLL